jgi:uncharacterized protein (DUF2235 family)
MPKNIVICCDGTGNEFGESNSNVVKLYKVLERSDQQIAYYHPGVGTIGSRNALTQIGRWWTRVVGLAFGYGISDNVADAYQFLMKTFQPGDLVFIFGFSRGAYTARVLCGLLHFAGLLTQGNEGLIPYAIRMMKKKKIDFGVAASFKKTFSQHECKPHFVGVWDTVSSVGWVYNAVHFPFTKVTHNPDIGIARHAVSIDERRAFFPQNLLGEPNSTGQNVLEVWFAGAHSDVGGSYAESESQLSKLALRWMLCEAEIALLRVDQHRKAEILGGKPPSVAPDPLTKNQHESLHGVWWIAEFWPKILRMETPDGKWKKSFHLNLGRRRCIEINSIVHESVTFRMQNTNYKPTNLPQVMRTAGDQCQPAISASR